jgi:DNA-binding CsgD family transcriptional regulator
VGRSTSPADLTHKLEQVNQLLVTVGTLTGVVAAPVPTESFDIARAEQALNNAVDVVAARLRRAGSERDLSVWKALLPLLTQLQQSRIFLRDAASKQRGDAVGTVRESLARLRSLSSVAELVERLTDELGNVGFRRRTPSDVHGGVWTAGSAPTGHDEELEAELVRRRKPMLVRDAPCYVAAPVVAGDAVIGFLHADDYLGSPMTDDFSRDLLGMFAEGVGHAIERITYYERLRTIRSQLDDYTQGVGDLFDEFIGTDVEPSTSDPTPPPAGDTTSGALTRRELEILRHMASGATNAQIATRLVLSEGTVKSHVKHILRKLGAVNRAQAVARYHAAR